MFTLEIWSCPVEWGIQNVTGKLANLITWTTASSNSMKVGQPCGATQDGRVMVERSDRMWSTGEGNGEPLQYSSLENPMNSMKRQKDRILKDELSQVVYVPNMLLEISAERTSERMKGWSQSKNNTQLWM